MASGKGVVSKRSAHSVEETIDRLEAVLREKSVHIFARIDQAAEAASVGLTLRPTILLLFGNPKTGTPLMDQFPLLAIDLPLKILVSEDADGKVWISYNSPRYLQARHGVPQELIQNIAVVEALAAKAAE